MGFESVFFLGFQAVPLALMVLCIIDIIRHERPREWFWIVVILPVVGSLIYLANFYLIGSFGWRRLDVSFKRGRRLKELKRLSAVQDTAGLWLEMGELHLQRGEWKDALEALRRAIDHDAELLKAQYYAGLALIQLGRFEQATVPLQYVVEMEPDYQFGEARLALAHALSSAGKKSEAIDVYTAILERHNYPEAVLRHALLVAERGDRASARAALERLVREAQAHTPPRKDRKWIREAKKELGKLVG